MNRCSSTGRLGTYSSSTYMHNNCLCCTVLNALARFLLWMMWSDCMPLSSAHCVNICKGAFKLLLHAFSVSFNDLSNRSYTRLVLWSRGNHIHKVKGSCLGPAARDRSKPLSIAPLVCVHMLAIDTMPPSDIGDCDRDDIHFHEQGPTTSSSSSRKVSGLTPTSGTTGCEHMGTAQNAT
jgi:hypothetical protein